MQELHQHQIYELLATKYTRIDLDYVILSAKAATLKGLELHRQAVLEAFQILNLRFAEYDYQINIQPEKMQAIPGTLEELLQLPPENYHNKALKKDRSFSIPQPLTYWCAFLEPPQGNPYQVEDFVAFNKLLFPDSSSVEVYRWNDTFSNYFDAGKEGWGTALWTAFDKKRKIIVVIGASLTD